MPGSERITCTTCGNTVKTTHMEAHETTLFHIRKGKQQMHRKRQPEVQNTKANFGLCPNDAKHT